MPDARGPSIRAAAETIRPRWTLLRLSFAQFETAETHAPWFGNAPETALPVTAKAEAVKPDLEAVRVMPVTVLPAIVPLKVHAELQAYVPLANNLPFVSRLTLPEAVVPLTVPVTGTPPKVLPAFTPTVLGSGPSGAESRRS